MNCFSVSKMNLTVVLALAIASQAHTVSPRLQLVWKVKDRGYVRNDYVFVDGKDGRRSVIDPLTGKTLLKLPEPSFYRTQGNTILIINWKENPYLVEARNLRTGKSLWKLKTDGRVKEFVWSGDKLFYASDTGIHSAQVKTKFVQPSTLPIGSSMFVNGGQLFYSSAPRFFGLQTKDVKRGWWNYCIPGGAVMSTRGPIVKSGLLHSIIGLNLDGKKIWDTYQAIPGWRIYVDSSWLQIRNGAFVASGRIAQEKEPNKIISQYLFSFTTDGKLNWKVPMNAENAVTFGRYIGVIQQNWDGSSSVQIRSLSNGALLFQEPRKYVNTSLALSAANDVLLITTDKETRAYQFR